MNDKKVKSLIKIGEHGRYAVSNGLYLRVANQNVGYWIVRYTIHKKRREITIGKYPELSLAAASLKTAHIKLDVKNNIDPIAQRSRGDTELFETVDQLAEDWLKECDKRLKHPNIPRRVYQKDIAPVIGELTIEQVNPRDIRAIITRIADSNRPTIANDALMYCKQLFRHSIKLDLRESNPAASFDVNDAGGVEKSRNRALSLDELEKVFVCLRENSDQFMRENYLAVALLLTLAVRKGELIAAKWDEFDLRTALWNVPEERSKMGVGISIPLSKEVLVWLNELKIRAYNSEYVFPNRRASKRGHISPDTINAAIQKLFREEKMPVEHFTVHDLRRTCRSLLSGLKVSGHVAERCLNHKLKGVEGIYDRYDYLDERKEALGMVSKLLEPIISPVLTPT